MQNIMWSNEELVGNPQVLILQLSYFFKKIAQIPKVLEELFFGVSCPGKIGNRTHNKRIKEAAESSFSAVSPIFIGSPVRGGVSTGGAHPHVCTALLCLSACCTLSTELCWDPSA